MNIRVILISTGHVTRPGALPSWAHNSEVHLKSKEGVEYAPLERKFPVM